MTRGNTRYLADLEGRPSCIERFQILEESNGEKWWVLMSESRKRGQLRRTSKKREIYVCQESGEEMGPSEIQRVEVVTSKDQKTGGSPRIIEERNEFQVVGDPYDDGFYREGRFRIVGLGTRELLIRAHGDREMIVEWVEEDLEGVVCEGVGLEVGEQMYCVKRDVRAEQEQEKEGGGTRGGEERKR